MSASRSGTIGAVAFALLAFGAASAQANFVQNPGFETGDFTSWGANSGAPAGLAVVPQGYNSDFSASFSGGTAPHHVLAQSLTLDGTSTQFLVGFWLYNNGVGDDGLVVRIEGVDMFSESPIGGELESWTYYSFIVESDAPASAADIEIVGYDSIASFLIDDVSVTAVPTPGALAVTAMGLGVMGRRRRR